VAKELAEKQYEALNAIQDRSFESDFERVSKKLLSRKRAITRERKTE
jgi:hypothetical protein